MIESNVVYGSIFKITDKINEKLTIVNYVDIDNGVMYQSDRYGCLQLLYGPDGKPKVYPYLKRIQALLKEQYEVDRVEPKDTKISN